MRVFQQPVRPLVLASLLIALGGGTLSLGQEPERGPLSSVTVSIGALELDGAAGELLRNVKLNCTAVAVAARALHCVAGRLSAELGDVDTVSGAFRVEYSAGDSKRLELDVRGSSGMMLKAVFELRANVWFVNGELSDLDIASFRYLLPARYWPADLTDERGKLSLTMRASAQSSGSMRTTGTLSLRGAGFDGANVAEELDADLVFSLQRENGIWSTETGLRLSAGIAYFEPGFEISDMRPGFTIEVLDQPIALEVSGRWDPARQHLQLEHGELDHPGVGQVQGELVAQLGDEFIVERATLALHDIDMNGAFSAYLQPLLLASEFARLETVGTLNAAFEWHDQRVRALSVDFDDAHIYDEGGRFQLAGLNGGFEFTGGGAPVYSILTWQGGAVYRIDFGSGKVGFESRESRINLNEWSDVTILDGALRVDSLSLEHIKGYDFELVVGGELTPVSMQALTHALDWPIMSGKLSGRIPALTYRHRTLKLDGDLLVQVFDGKILLRNLAVDQLLGLVPRVYADIDVEEIDLEQLTSTFSFGRIEGHLSGYIHKLQLDAWQPVYFEAEFATPENDKTRHRISQQAVDNLGVLGAGTGAGLSSGFLRFFRNYSYDRLGLSCRLYNGHCQLGGVAETSDGFYILTAGGLVPPWINVKGTGRSVEWQVLVDGIKRIASGEDILVQ